MAFHSQALSKNVPLKRCQHSTVSCFLGKSVIQVSLTEISNVSQKVAKVTLSFKQCCLKQQAETSAFLKARGNGGVRGGRRPVLPSDAIMYLVSILRGCADFLSPHPPWVMPAPWGPQLRLRLPTCLLVQLYLGAESPCRPLRVKP